jgi:hypothetical protein
MCSFLLLAVGCTPYHFYTIKSYDIPPETQALVVDSDTLQIVYAVSRGANGMVINIQNKSESPIFVDWSQSAVILDSKITVYPFDITGTAQTMSGNPMGNTRFIPPRSTLQSTPIALRARIYTVEEMDRSFKKQIIKTTQGESKTIRYTHYTPENSPIHFRSYLTFYSEKMPKTPMRIEHSFWASELLTCSDVHIFDKLKPKQKQPFDTNRNTKLLMF